MRKYKQLSFEERSDIQTQLTLGFKASWIAIGLGRSISTISRELHRNGWIRAKVPAKRGRPAIAGKYRAVLAQDRAEPLSTKPMVVEAFTGWEYAMAGSDVFFKTRLLTRASC